MTPLLLSGLLVSLSGTAASPASARVAPAPVLAAFDEEGSTAEDVEVLRRLLVKGLMPQADSGVLDLLKDAQTRGTYERFVTTHEGVIQDLGLYAQGPSVQHSRGFHAPGAGLFYCIELSVPAAARTVDPSTNGKPAEPDEWESTQREVRYRQQGSPTNVGLLTLGSVFQRTTTWVLDPAAIDKAVEQVLGTLAEHGARVRGLAPSDSITVALHVSAKGWADQTAIAQGDYLGSLVGYTSLREERVVIRVGRQALESYLGGRLPLSELRAAAQVTRY